jgi:hypothetical protein
LEKRLVAAMKSMYEGTPRPQQTELLLKHFADNQPAVRVLAVDLVDQTFVSKQLPVPDSVKKAVTDRLADESPRVRIAAADEVPYIAEPKAAALLLAQMLVPEPMRPGWSQALRMSASVLPHARLLDVDARMELAAARPVIVPDTIVIDGGKVFISEVFTRACAWLGISVQRARPHTPTDKPQVAYCTPSG